MVWQAGDWGFLLLLLKSIYYSYFFPIIKCGFFWGGGGGLVEEWEDFHSTRESRRNNGWRTTQNFVWKCVLEILPATCQYIRSLINFIISNLANRFVYMRSVTARNENRRHAQNVSLSCTLCAAVGQFQYSDTRQERQRKIYSSHNKVLKYTLLLVCRCIFLCEGDLY